MSPGHTVTMKTGLNSLQLRFHRPSSNAGPTYRFSGQTGAVVGSGRGLATTAATYGLAKDVTLLVRKLPSALFDKNLKQRTCGRCCAS